MFYYKRILIAVIIFYFSASKIATGQSFKNRISISPQVGYAWVKLTHAESKNYKEMSFESKTTLNVNYGLLIQYSISKLISLNTGFIKETKGGEVDYRYLSISDTRIVDKRFEIAVANKYSTIPFFVRFSSKDKISFFGDIGGYVSTLKGCNIKSFRAEYDIILGNYNQATIGRSQTVDMSHTNKIDIGVLLGGGISYELNKHLSVQLIGRVNLGLRKLDALHSNDKIFFNDINDYRFRDYYGLNSFTKNFVISINTGLVYKI